MSDVTPAKVGGTTSADIAAVLAKGALGAIPFAGGLLAEVAGSLIPGQKMDRLIKFAESLERRLSEAERELFATRAKTPEGTDLVEDALHQASRAISADRTSRIVELLTNGLTEEQFDHDGSKKLLWLLGELADPELVWLVYIGRNYDESMLELHSQVLSHRTAHLGSGEAEHDSAAVQSSWRRRLLDLGLVKAAGYNSGGVDLAFSGLETAAEEGSLELTQLGRMLIRSLGEEPAW